MLPSLWKSRLKFFYVLTICKTSKLLSLLGLLSSNKYATHANYLNFKPLTFLINPHNDSIVCLTDEHLLLILLPAVDEDTTHNNSYSNRPAQQLQYLQDITTTVSTNMFYLLIRLRIQLTKCTCPNKYTSH